MVGIYRISSPDGRIYIGQSRDIERRFREYKSLKGLCKSTLYYSFINEGIKNHLFVIVQEFPVNIEQTVLNEAEIDHWNYYRDQGCVMLNTDYPGNSHIHSVPVYQYSQDGKFIKEWLSANEAGRHLNIPGRAICLVTKGQQKQAGGFIWLRTKHSYITEFKYKKHILKVK